jgi:hypothetical protein
VVFQLAPFLAQSAPGVGVLGSIVGGSATLAKNIKARKNGESDMSNSEIAVDTAKEAAGAGVATAFSAVVVGAVGGGLVVSLGTAFGAAVVGKYAWDRGVERFSAKDE